jgi:hypothetical protein
MTIPTRQTLHDARTVRGLIGSLDPDSNPGVLRQGCETIKDVAAHGLVGKKHPDSLQSVEVSPQLVRQSCRADCHIVTSIALHSV